MNGKKENKKDLYRVNRQFKNAYNWLLVNEYITSAADLARQMGISTSTISEYKSCKRPLQASFAQRFQADVLSQYGDETLEDFETEILTRQARQAVNPTNKQVASLLSTMLLKLEGGQQTILDLITDLKTEVGELRTEVAKLKRR